jgi:hypothetical protein
VAIGPTIQSILRVPGQIVDIPGEKMLGQFQEQASKEGRLKGGCEMALLMRGDFVNRKKHAIGEEKRE